MAITKQQPKGNPQISPNALIELHSQTAKVLAEALRADEVDPKVLELAIRFLDNNGISAPPTEPNQERAQATLTDTLDELGKLGESFLDEDQKYAVG